MPTVKLKKTKWTDQMFLAAVLYSSPPEGLRLTHLTGEPTLSSISSRLPCYSCNPHKPSFQNCNFGHKTINKTEMQRRRLASLLQPTLPTCTCQSAMVKHPRILAGTGAEMLIILITSSAFPPSLEKSMNNLALLKSRLKRLLTEGHGDTPGPWEHRNLQSGWLSQGHPALKH